MKIRKCTTVELARLDLDLEVALPGGGSILIQQRTEHGSVDIIFHANVKVYSHFGDDLEPAKKVKEGRSVVHSAKQLVIFGLIEPDVKE